MRLPSTPEMDRLRKIYEPYIKRNEKGSYIPDDAPTEAKLAYKKSCELTNKEFDEEVQSWFL